MVRTARYSYGATSTAAPDRPRPACRDEDPDLFFPVGDSGPALLQEQQAKAVCRRCLLIERCLQGALERNEAGVWGGMSEQERRSLKRRTARARASAA
ncbi:WhiB family transcriptional regulator [Streptomyces sp. NPDC090994]|uniref:WhiB family transcriptional regulator n=1 Tax=Streptomyces sp. NPDC090994 TaxID=3365969 RepID=UPI003806FE6C